MTARSVLAVAALAGVFASQPHGSVAGGGGGKAAHGGPCATAGDGGGEWYS
jgi:hypothetical protein